MAKRTGPAARVAIDPKLFVTFLDMRARYITGGTPHRTRAMIYYHYVSETDARMIRRWRTGKITGVTVKSAEALLARHGLYLDDYARWCEVNDLAPTIRGKLPTN